jgi:hypothetical protein
VILLDLYAKRFLALAGRGAGARTLEATGESFRFGLDLGGEAEAALAAFATSTGWELGRRYFIGSANTRGPYVVVAEFAIGT